MTKRLMTATALAVALFGIACSSGSSNPSGAAGSSDDELRSSNAQCGGLAGIRCSIKGEICKSTSSEPDAFGNCVRAKKGTEGALCGGIANIQCNNGFDCNFDVNVGGSDASGTCTASSVGGTGNGPTCLTLTCVQGTHCEQKNGKASCVDNEDEPTCLTLTCVQGTHCEQKSGKASCVDDEDAPTCLTLTCRSGYHCESNSGHASCVAN